MTKPITSPWAPQPKQWKKPLSSLTVNDGLFALWNGNRPGNSRPRLSSRTERTTRPDRGKRGRRSDRKEKGKAIKQRTRTRNRNWAEKRTRQESKRKGQRKR